ncbi:TIGR03758 family integrating conjugative element protein [Paraburkholderia aspalathi]|uniref:Integrating conjugative element protein, PFL_4701 family n=1 Tax=Paraburkholderia aspalathi TaxID=1324617 RepID=A0A1I7ABD4_9BURK|nr:TIGR03758 family integrating conjugative element protein [Paraburkholderia aspalathi]SFT72214.1 integrating conjugative element protein, PFL_4701 family [Paraburkholderia aspalathi]
MNLTGDQATAFQSNGGFTPAAVSTLMYGVVFATVLVWGVWAIRTAYVGWADHRISQRQFLGVAVRFAAIYVVLTFFLLS